MKHKRNAGHGLGFYIRYYFVAALNLVSFVERLVTLAAAQLVLNYPMLEPFFERYLGQAVVLSWCSLIYLIAPYYTPYEPEFEQKPSPEWLDEHPEQKKILSYILEDLHPDIRTWVGLRSLFFQKLFEQNLAFLEWCWDSYLIVQCIEWSPMLCLIFSENLVPAAMVFAFLFSYLRFGLLNEERRAFVHQIQEHCPGLHGEQNYYQRARAFIAFIACAVCSYGALLGTLYASHLVSYAVTILLPHLQAYTLPLYAPVFLLSSLIIFITTPYPVDALKVFCSLFWNNYRYSLLLERAHLLDLITPGSTLISYPLLHLPLSLLCSQLAFEQWRSSNHRHLFNRINEDIIQSQPSTRLHYAP